jgi:hypothetical protein
MADRGVATLGMEQAGRMELRGVPLLAFTTQLLGLDAAQLEERMAQEVAENPAIRVHRRCSRCGMCRLRRSAGGTASRDPRDAIELWWTRRPGWSCLSMRSPALLVRSDGP